MQQNFGRPKEFATLLGYPIKTSSGCSVLHQGLTDKHFIEGKFECFQAYSGMLPHSHHTSVKRTHLTHDRPAYATHMREKFHHPTRSDQSDFESHSKAHHRQREAMYHQGAQTLGTFPRSRTSEFVGHGRRRANIRETVPLDRSDSNYSNPAVRKEEYRTVKHRDKERSGNHRDQHSRPFRRSYTEMDLKYQRDANRMVRDHRSEEFHSRRREEIKAQRYPRERVADHHEHRPVRRVDGGSRGVHYEDTRIDPRKSGIRRNHSADLPRYKPSHTPKDDYQDLSPFERRYYENDIVRNNHDPPDLYKENHRPRTVHRRRSAEEPEKHSRRPEAPVPVPVYSPRPAPRQPTTPNEDHAEKVRPREAHNHVHRSQGFERYESSQGRPLQASLQKQPIIHHTHPERKLNRERSLERTPSTPIYDDRPVNYPRGQDTIARPHPQYIANQRRDSRTSSGHPQSSITPHTVICRRGDDANANYVVETNPNRKNYPEQDRFQDDRHLQEIVPLSQQRSKEPPDKTRQCPRKDFETTQITMQEEMLYVKRTVDHSPPRARPKDMINNNIHPGAISRQKHTRVKNNYYPDEKDYPYYHPQDHRYSSNHIYRDDYDQVDSRLPIKRELDRLYRYGHDGHLMRPDYEYDARRQPVPSEDLSDEDDWSDTEPGDNIISGRYREAVS